MAGSEAQALHCPHVERYTARSAPAAAPETSDHHHHRPKRIARFEGLTDYLTIAIVVALGLALVIGFFTAGGDAPWMN